METPTSQPLSQNTVVEPGKITISGTTELKDWTKSEAINPIDNHRVPDGVLPDNNPKSAYGVKKAPTLSVIPASAILVLGQVMALGAQKYGRFNYREKNVAASVYVDAALRHLIAWNAGQDTDPESGVSHLGHVLACASILIDAQGLDKLVDDRSKNQAEQDLLERFTKS
jgi:hypothetical protein